MPSVTHAIDALNEVEGFISTAINHIENAYSELENLNIEDADAVKDAIDSVLTELHYAVKELNG